MIAIAAFAAVAIYRFLICSPPMPMQQELMIYGLRFIEIGPESPEQYEVYADGEKVGYVRYRFGYLSADYQDAGMEEIFGRELKFQTGQMTDRERGRWLPVIARKLKHRIKHVQPD